MSRVELLGVSIKREKDIAKFIPYVSEQQFALFLLQEKKHYRVYYERYLYTRECEQGGEQVTQVTRPDFYLVNKKNGHSFHIELTVSPRGKYKQRQVMSEQGVPYFIFYRDSLKKLGERYQRDLLGENSPRLRVSDYPSEKHWVWWWKK